MKLSNIKWKVLTFHAFVMYHYFCTLLLKMDGGLFLELLEQIIKDPNWTLQQYTKLREDFQSDFNSNQDKSTDQELDQSFLSSDYIFHIIMQFYILKSTDEKFEDFIIHPLLFDDELKASKNAKNDFFHSEHGSLLQSCLKLKKHRVSKWLLSDPDIDVLSDDVCTAILADVIKDKPFYLLILERLSQNELRLLHNIMVTFKDYKDTWYFTTFEDFLESRIIDKEELELISKLQEIFGEKNATVGSGFERPPEQEQLVLQQN